MKDRVAELTGEIILKKTVKRILLIIWAFALLFISSTGVKADEPVSMQRTIKVAGDNNFPPFEYMSDSGVYTGFNVDIMNAVSIETGVKIEYEPMPWNEAQEALRLGKVDAIEGMKYSKSRDQLYDFSAPYLKSSDAIFVIRENMYIFAQSDLEGQKIAVQKGDIAIDLLSSLQRANFLTTESQEEAINLLLEGKADAFIGNRITGQYILQKNNDQAKVKIVGLPLNPSDYCIAVLPQNKALLKIFNKGISEIKTNGTYDKIQQKWFPEYNFPPTVNLDKVLFYLKISSIIVILIFILVLWWNRLLKKEVAARVMQISEINKELEDKMVQLEGNVLFQKQLLDSTYYFLVTLDQGRRITNINKKAIEYFQIDEEVIGELIDNTILARIVNTQEITDVLEKGSVFLKREKQLENLFSLRDKKFISYSMYPIMTVPKEISGVIINLDDITERKHFEKEIEREDRLRSLGQLVLGIAHEMRNPLMAILTYTQLLPKKVENEEFRRLFVQHVPNEIERLNGLVNELLDFARPKKSAPTPFPLDQLILSVNHLLRQKLQDKKIQVEFNMDNKLKVYADMQQIKQVFINIILNAIESVELHGWITITSFGQDDFVVTEVEDNGPGVSDEEIDKLFEPFYSTKVNGVGLGLSITYQLIKANKGSLDVKSNLGEGLKFSIALPRLQERDINNE